MFNKNPVLDKGSVSLYSAAPSQSVINALAATYYKSCVSNLQDVMFATMAVVCPVGVRLFIAQTGLTQQMFYSEQEAKAYIPNVGSVGGPTLDDNERMATYLQETLDSLLITPLGLIQDGCDPAIAQLILPLAMYNNIVVHGSLRQWLNFINATTDNKIIKEYQETVRGVLKAEWPNLNVWEKTDGTSKTQGS